MTKLRQLPETTLRRYKDRNGWFLEVVDDRGFSRKDRGRQLRSREID
jgi:hypothetical protein